jgi:hypothetical protein
LKSLTILTPLELGRTIVALLQAQSRFILSRDGPGLNTASLGRTFWA